MKHVIYIFILLITTSLFAQTNQSDSLKLIPLKGVVVTSNRLPVSLKSNPGSVSLVEPGVLNLMPRGIGAEEALRLVPGVRIDNQHDGERIHLSIRGQGILTERGLRGIGVMLDGIPLNDPSGFAPDLYDVDWNTVKRIEVLRGPVASLYGGGGSAGMLNIQTKNGGAAPFGGEIGQEFGSHAFRKSFIQLDGTKNDQDYRISYSRTDGNGYRDHQAFWGNNLYEKINFRPSKGLTITQIVSHVDYFQQNPEGLALNQLDNPLQANPDARPFNEYQKTNRTRLGIIATYKLNDRHDFQLSGFDHLWNYKETSNKAAEYRTINAPGLSAQYNLHLACGKLMNHFSLGTDMKWQKINMYKLQSASDTNRVESIDEANLETDTLLANQIISQSSLGAFFLYHFEMGKFNFLGNIRFDAMNNMLTDKMMGPDSAKTTKNFNQTSIRLGANYAFTDAVNLFANWSQGFLPPSTEELASNPTGYHGFNTHLIPATSVCSELGVRGFLGSRLYYEVTGFLMNTKDDFFRFKQSGRGNQEVFYGNAGNSERKGVEVFLSWKVIEKLSLQMAYTYADYKYTSATIDPVYLDTTYVLTTPPAAGQILPNSPKHQLYAEITYSINKNLKITLGTEYQSKWAIYTDAKAYAGQLDPTIYQNWQEGFNLFHARISYQWNLWGLKGECSVFARNLTGAKYMAFTEPDPDGNSYQPGPKAEYFGSLKFKF